MYRARVQCTVCDALGGSKQQTVNRQEISPTPWAATSLFRQPQQLLQLPFLLLQLTRYANSTLFALLASPPVQVNDTHYCTVKRRVRKESASLFGVPDLLRTVS